MKKTVAIIGAGPTGLALASFLTSYGVKVEVFEKNKTTTPFSKAMVIHARTLEELDDIGIADLFVSQGEFFSKLKVLNISNQKETLNFGHIGKGMSKFSQILSLEQSKTEKVFVKHLKKQGVTINRSHELSHIKEEKQRSVLHFENGKKYKADYVVGCDGARSFIRHFLKFEFSGSTVDETFFVADTHIDSSVVNKKELYIKFADKNFCLIFPIAGQKKHYRVIGVVPAKHKDNESLKFEDIQDYLTSALNLKMTFGKTNWFSTYRVHSRYCHFGKGRYFLAGDAAHIHSPAGGRGMNTGIQDAYNLGRKLAAIINGQADKSLLDTYDEERYPVAKELIETTDRLFHWMTSSVLFSFIFRNIVIKLMALIINTGFLNKKIFPFLSMLTVGYEQSNALVPSQLGRLKAGYRLPYHAPLYKKVVGKGFLILSHELDIADAPCEVLKIKDYEKIGKPYYIILRPDKHIAYVGDDRDIVGKYFSGLGM